MTDALIVLDIGKTNVKLALVDAAGALLAEQRRPNAILPGGPYPHHDVDGIWDWMLATCRTFSTLAQVTAIVPVTHGATAALVDADGLVLPVLDYEAALPGCDYTARPPFAETYSPALPVVASHVGGIPEVVSEQVEGSLVPPQDVEALARALARYASDPVLARQHGNAGRTRIVQQYSMAAMVTAYTALYARLCRQKRVASP